MPRNTRLWISVAILILLTYHPVITWHLAPSRSAKNKVTDIFVPAPASALPCHSLSTPRPIMILALGQSNAGNHGELAANLKKTNYFFAGKCYETSGPAPGATGRGGNIWARLSPQLSSATGKAILFSVIAVDATKISDWVEPGKVQKYFLDTLADNKKHNFVPDIVLWQHGEADAAYGTTTSEYMESLAKLLTLLRSSGVTAPVFVSLSTRCRNDGSGAIRTALLTTATRDARVRIGPDTDTLYGSLRHDGCHFSTTGLEAAATLWYQSLLPALIPESSLRPILKARNNSY